jgi:hypothetical protein
MRFALALSVLLAGPAAAWEFSPAPVCTLSHESPEGAVTVTWDPGRAEAYAITVTRTGAWPDGPVFAIRFDGPRAIAIQTDRHAISEDGSALTVTDRGFGNVLDGLEFNGRATAILGGAEVGFSLEGAAAPVRAFRACTGAAIAARVVPRRGA